MEEPRFLKPEAGFVGKDSKAKLKRAKTAGPKVLFLSKSLRNLAKPIGHCSKKNLRSFQKNVDKKMIGPLGQPNTGNRHVVLSNSKYFSINRTITSSNARLILHLHTIC